VRYVVQTDAPCKHCGERHEYTTQFCVLQVYVDVTTAAMVAQLVEGIVRPIEGVPENIDYVLVTLKHGRPDPSVSQSRSTLSSGVS
jgi:hypothetical protein